MRCLLSFFPVSVRLLLLLLRYEIGVDRGGTEYKKNPQARSMECLQDTERSDDIRSLQEQPWPLRSWKNASMARKAASSSGVKGDESWLTQAPLPLGGGWLWGGGCSAEVITPNKNSAQCCAGRPDLTADRKLCQKLATGTEITPAMNNSLLCLQSALRNRGRTLLHSEPVFPQTGRTHCHPDRICRFSCCFIWWQRRRWSIASFSVRRALVTSKSVRR